MTSVDQRPHAVRFNLLAHLCYALGDQQECGSMLVHPRRSETVLWVPYPARPGRRLGVGAVDHRGHWTFTFGDQWSPAGNMAEAAARIAWAVRTR